MDGGRQQSTYCISLEFLALGQFCQCFQMYKFHESLHVTVSRFRQFSLVLSNGKFHQRSREVFERHEESFGACYTGYINLYLP